MDKTEVYMTFKYYVYRTVEYQILLSLVHICTKESLNSRCYVLTPFFSDSLMMACNICEPSKKINSRGLWISFSMRIAENSSMSQADCGYGTNSRADNGK